MTAEAPGTPIIAPPSPPSELSRWRSYKRPTLVAECLVVILNVFVMTGWHLPPFLGPALGFWFLVIQPVQLLYGTSLWGKSSSAESFSYSLTSVLLALMLLGLAADLVLPLVGLQRPLDPVPVVLIADALTVALYALRQRYPGERVTRLRWSAVARAIDSEESRLLLASAFTVVLAVLGANRLNNGAGDSVSLAALCVGVLTLVFLLLWRHKLREGIIQATLYLLSLGLLLMTSLRGWYVTGHDIQTEYQVFQLTKAHGRWETALHNAYNACLSITILPTEFADILRVDGPYIYKVFFQLLFAVCPVMVYSIARRYCPVSTSILAAIYFVSFPTFFTDMPFINRQEIALLFVCVAVLAITNESWDLRRRRLTLLASCVGVEVSHYSSMYIFLGIVAIAWLADRLMLLLSLRSGGRAHAHPWATATRSVSIAPLLAAAVMTFAWGFLATQSPGAVVSDARSSISGLFGHSGEARSGNVGYSLLFWKTSTAQQVLDDYSSSVLKLRDNSHRTTYIERQGLASQYQAKAVQLPLLPLTRAGHLLSDVGVPVAGMNTAVRLAAADLEQIFAVLGLLAFLVVRRFKRRVGREFFCLAIGSVGMLVVVTVLPNLSVDYGVLRVFQEALILVAPVIVTGSLAIFRPIGETWAPRIAAAVCIAIFVSTTGLLPQTLGGYPAQLSLNNSGLYYDSYYLHPQEVTGVQWLAAQNGVLPDDIQATHNSDRFLFTAPSNVSARQFIEDAFPTLLRAHAWVILDYSILRTGIATASYDGDVIPYRYPVGVLVANKNLVYNDGGMEIFR
ncbi:MAG: DUF2206 domain-containing protein [Acidimicrobiales bacterium]